ncbi:MAG: redox-sensing transcriptional repressor Rex [Acidobacteria bacterium]|nr:redox-sensing transcriptional repressor Rex [Acidobacteriota bacterium]MBV9474746.1 redox-sensing transcriptional repressor Rex [Acidobacteriota bacterium]
MGRTANSDREGISELTTGRLSVYLRCLTFLESQGQKTVSSHELAEKFHLNSAQIRKDLACFGEFGTRGVGYDVSRLRRQLVETLGIDRVRNAIIVGAGNLGMALADYAGFNSNGFHIVAMLDTDASKTGKTSRQGIPVVAWERLGELVRRNRVDIGIIAVPGEHAQHVYDALADAGVLAVLNFAPVQIRLRHGVKVKSVDLRINLESLSFHLKNVEDGVIA